MLDGFFITDTANQYRNQQIEITIYVPEGTVVYSEANATSYYGFNSDINELTDWDSDSHYFRILKNKSECLDCKEKVQGIKKDSIETIKALDSIDSLQPIDTKKIKDWEEEVKTDFQE